MPKSGVRISWLMVARNCVLAWLADSARSLASTSAACTCLSAVTSLTRQKTTGSPAWVVGVVLTSTNRPSPSASSRGPCCVPPARACSNQEASLHTHCRASPLDSRSEEHTSELQSQSNLVCRLLLEKKKNTKAPTKTHAT